MTFEWKETHQKAFDDVKATIEKETMLYCPDYEVPFLIFPGALGKQLESHMPQIKEANADFLDVDAALKHEHLLVLFHSWKLNNCQMNCIVTDEELLIMLGTLIEHRSMSHDSKHMLSQTIQNLTYHSTNHSSYLE